MFFDLPGHNQAVERCVKEVIATSQHVISAEAKDQVVDHCNFSTYLVEWLGSVKMG